MNTLYRRRNYLPAILGGLFVVLVALFAGLIAALANKLLLVGFVGAGAAAAVAFLPMRWTLWGVLILSFLVVGNLRYFFEIGLLHWIPYLLGLGLIVQYLMTVAAQRRALHLPSFFAAYAVFLLTALFACLLSDAHWMQFAIASKNYFFLLGILLIFGSGLLDAKDLFRIWHFFLVIAVLQAPFALYQYTFVAGKRSQAAVSGDFAPWDAVVGTLGGNPDGGGASQAMGILITICIVASLGFRKYGLLRTRWVVLIAISGLASVLLAEVKAAFMLLPVGIGLLFWKQIIRRPLEATLAGLVLAGLITLMPLAYEKLHYSRTSDFRSTQQLNDTFVDKIERQLNPDKYNFRNPVLSRGALLYFWWSENGARGDVKHTLFGYGMGATQRSRLAPGELAQRYFYNLPETTASILLWETGLVGFGAFVLMLVWAARSAIALSKRVAEARDRSMLEVTAVSLVIILLSLPYHSFSVTVPGAQLLLVLLLAHVAYYGHVERAAARVSQQDMRRRTASATPAAKSSFLLR